MFTDDSAITLYVCAKSLARPGETMRRILDSGGKRWTVELVVLAGYMRLIGRPILDAFPGGEFPHHGGHGVGHRLRHLRHRAARSLVVQSF